MKKNFILLGILVIVLVTTFSFRTVQPTLTGKVSPADAAEMVWAINSTDSAKAAIVGGTFTFTVKPGKYRVIVDAKEPRRDVILENIEVGNQPVDLGEIVIQ